MEKTNPSSPSSTTQSQSTGGKRSICSKILIYPLLAWFLFVVLTLLYLIFVCPWYYQNICKLLPILHGLFIFYVGQNFLQSTCMDPGKYHPMDRREEEVRLRVETGTYSVNQRNLDVVMCTTCFIVKPPRTHHCRYCGACIDTMDHHCPWLDNCVGRRNYRFFLRFLFTLIVHINLTFICSLYLIVALRENLTEAKVFISFFLVFSTALLAGPAGGLLGLHIILVSKNTTTFEQVTGKFLDLPHTPFHRSFTQNWLRICCTSVPPQLNRYPTENSCQKNEKHSIV